MAEQQRRIGRHFQLVCVRVDVQPPVCADFIGTDLRSDTLRKDLGSASGQGIQAGLLQGREYLCDTEPMLLSKPIDLHGSQGLDGDVRQDLLGVSKQIHIVFQRLVFRQSAYYVQIFQALPAWFYFSNCLGQLQGIGIRGIRFTPECTQTTLVFADIGGIDVQAMNKKDLLSMA